MKNLRYRKGSLVQTHFRRRRNLQATTQRVFLYSAKQDALTQSKRGTCCLFKDLGLQGLSEACDEQFPFIKRLLWGIFWLILLLICMTQCAISLNNFLSSPTNVNIVFKTNKVVTPPTVTFCTTDEYGRIPAIWQPTLRRKYGNISYKTTDELLNKTKMNIGTMWNISTFAFDNLTYNIATWPFNIGAENVEVSNLVTLTGVCLSFKTTFKMPCSGKQAYLVIVATGDKADNKYEDYLVILHSEAEIPLIRYYGPKANGVYMQLKTWATVEIRRVEEKFLNSRKHPCIPETEYFQCEAACMENLIRIESEDKLKERCRLPFMQYNNSVRLCSTPSELREMLLVSERSVDKMLGEGEICNCQRPCKRMIYSVEYVKTGQQPKPIEFYLAFPKCYFQSTHEQFSYGTTSFMADIGGALGLYLGMSILSFVQFLETIIMCICKLNKSWSK